MTGNQYGAGQVQGGGGQNRQGPPQAQSQQQPPPTPNTPPGIHGDMNKQPLIPNQPGQYQIQYTQYYIPQWFLFRPIWALVKKATFIFMQVA